MKSKEVFELVEKFCMDLECFDESDKFDYDDELFNCFEFSIFWDGEDFSLSMNDELPTSFLINLAHELMNFVNTGLSENMFIGDSFILEFDEEGKCSGTNFEDDYEKEFKKVEKKEVVQIPSEIEKSIL